MPRKPRLLPSDTSTASQRVAAGQNFQPGAHQTTAALREFPCGQCLPGCEAEESMADVRRLLTTDLTYSGFLDGLAARRLVATMLKTYKAAQTSPRWTQDPYLNKLGTGGERFSKVLSAIFDFSTNVEYCSARQRRVTDSKWIYCNAAQDGAAGTAPGTCARVFYSFLKQCPSCCLNVGLEARIEGAQHKPPSHHIGEITGSLMGMLLVPVLLSHTPALHYGMVTKQSHSVDAVAFNRDLAVLMEIKASPLVTLPIASDLTDPMTTDTDDGTREYDRHKLVDFIHRSAPLYFFVPHRNQRIPLGTPTTQSWPYDPVTAYMESVNAFLDYVSAWAELFDAFCVPKTERTGRVERVAYLTNGWGDEIDSNKTKPGLGRTDDLKKGTYQLLKYGAYYKDICKRRTLYSALLANLDPVNLWTEYLERLLDVRWTKEAHLTEVNNLYQVSRDRMYHLYEAIVAFNRPVLNEPRLRTIFDFDRAHTALVSGTLDTPLLEPWLA